MRLSWVTSSSSLPLLLHNPHIDNLWCSFDEAAPFQYDRIFSLDDEKEIIEQVMILNADRITGALLDDKNRCTYSDDACAWFDMGLLSRFGKMEADRLKRINTRSHGMIFSEMFGVTEIQPEFWGSATLEDWAKSLREGCDLLIGINPYAGGRWKSKELRKSELRSLVERLLQMEGGLALHARLVLLGVGEDRRSNELLKKELADPRVIVPITDESVLRLAAMIQSMDYLITSDSLPLHLAIAQGIPSLAFFSPTSAAEIDDFDMGIKLVSTSPDYCSYEKNADNSSITAERIINTAVRHRPDIFLMNQSKLLSKNMTP
jgi:heptosyltransferase-2